MINVNCLRGLPHVGRCVRLGAATGVFNQSFGRTNGKQFGRSLGVGYYEEKKRHSDNHNKKIIKFGWGRGMAREPRGVDFSLLVPTHPGNFPTKGQLVEQQIR